MSQRTRNARNDNAAQFLSLDVELELENEAVITYDDLIEMQDMALRRMAFE